MNASKDVNILTTIAWVFNQRKIHSAWIKMIFSKLKGKDRHRYSEWLSWVSMILKKATFCIWPEKTNDVIAFGNVAKFELF